MESIASWVAPIATAIAACMTAANLGSRVTGWGFVVFTVGSIAWTAYGIASDQQNLLWQNLFLTAVNILGIWRWLGRQARFDDGAKAAAAKSRGRAGPTLFPVSTLASASVQSRHGEALGTAVDAMAQCEDGRISYLMVSVGGVGGVGESLHALPFDQVEVGKDSIVTDLDGGAFARLDPVDPADWPARPQEVAATG